jgi:NitT/TauT family transport system ATP-binding protein
MNTVGNEAPPQVKLDASRNGVAPAEVVLDVRHLRKVYSDGRRETDAIADLSFAVARGEFLSVVGPSGCGKSTLLRCMSGLLSPSGGEVQLNGERIVRPPKNLALVFQDYSRSLFPWMTVRENIVLPLKYKAKGGEKQGRGEAVERAVESVGLTKFIDHYPWQLSGGMQQRVAIARALAFQPQILLMDEPFASVDAQTRAELQDLVQSVVAEYEMTTALVTHDIEEAVYLSDRVVLLSAAPCSVQREWDVDLPSPRDQVATRELPRFIELRAEIYTSLRPVQVAATVAAERKEL